MVNRLADASSPYLRQHADNPVDWREWGDEAFEEARRRDVPVFLSVGYASCHWCHVMAHESFEDEGVAEVLNEHFVAVKVDREERPDVDAVYMGAVQALTGHGGWPMSVFLAPDGTPFFGGTYWPKDDRGGMPGFMRVLAAVREAWDERRGEVQESGQRLVAHLASADDLGPAGGSLDEHITTDAAEGCVRAWDDRHGGFGAAPKFPQAMTIDFLLAHAERTGDAGASRAALHSLHQMACGGIYDHVGGGFHRYSVDAVWLVPHFEKMLYDNALLLRAYLHAWQAERHPRFRRVVGETADYLLRELRHPRGGFFSSTDADSEGVEGKFFVWSHDEFRAVVAEAGEDPDFWCAFFGVTPGGNFEGTNILHEPDPRAEDDGTTEVRLARVRNALHAHRAQRVAPALDDKVLTSWSALALGSLAEAGAVLGEERYVEAARDCARFLRDELVVGGELRHTWREGHAARVSAFLEDVAYLAQALLELYEADFDPAWLQWSVALAADADARFAEVRDGEPTGAYFQTAHDAEPLVTRPKELWDNATPAGMSVMADVHLRLAALTGDLAHMDRAERIIGLFGERARRAPTGYGELLRAFERRLAGPREVAIVGDLGDDRTRALLGAYRERWRPGAVLAAGPAGVDGDGRGSAGPANGEARSGSGAEPATPAAEAAPVPLLADRPLVDGRPAAYVCRNFVCDRPVTDADDLRALLGA